MKKFIKVVPLFLTASLLAASVYAVDSLTPAIKEDHESVADNLPKIKFQRASVVFKNYRIENVA